MDHKPGMSNQRKSPINNNNIRYKMVVKKLQNQFAVADVYTGVYGLFKSDEKI